MSYTTLNGNQVSVSGIYDSKSVQNTKHACPYTNLFPPGIRRAKELQSMLSKKNSLLKTCNSWYKKSSRAAPRVNQKNLLLNTGQAVFQWNFRNR